MACSRAASTKRCRINEELNAAPARRGLHDRPVSRFVGTSRSALSEEVMRRQAEPFASSARFKFASELGRFWRIAALRSDANHPTWPCFTLFRFEIVGARTKAGSCLHGKSGRHKRCRRSRSNLSVALSDVWSSSFRPRNVSQADAI